MIYQSPEQRPRVWMVCPAIGRPSEVWMYRQAIGIDRLQLRIYAKEHQFPDEYPLDPRSIEIIPFQTAVSRNRLVFEAHQGWNSWLNRRLGGFRGSTREASWWAEQIASHRPDVVICQYGTTGVRMFPIFDAYGVRTVIHFHAFDVTTALKSARYKRQLISVLPNLAGCILVAEYQRELIRELGARDDQIHIIPCGVPVEGTELNSTVGNQPCRFLAVGRFTAKKGPDLTLRAFARCVARVPEATLTMIGDGELFDSCRRLAAELQISEHVSFLGAQPHDRVRQELTIASVFVQHSTTPRTGNKEGWPVAIGEAAGSGLPIVSTRHASIPEQVEHGVTGLLAEEGDWETMGDHLLQLALDPARRVAMGAAAREKMAAFDVAHQVAKLEAVLLDAAGAARR